MIGPIRNKVYNYITDRQQVPSNFYYLGEKSVADVNSILKNSLFMVQTCDVEGFGNNFIQAWQQGRPTLTLYFDPENVIEKNKIGFYSKNFDQLVNDADILMSDDELRKSMGEQAKDFAEKNFKPKTNTRILEDFFNKI